MISQCPSCKKQIEVPAAAIGKKVRCSGCQAVFVVEASAVAPAPAPPPKKKTTDAPAIPPQPPAPADTPKAIAGEPKKKSTAKKKSEPAPAPLDVPGPIAEEPAKAAKKKDAAQKKPAPSPEPADSDNPFSFGDGDGGGGAEGAENDLAFAAPDPALDFAPQTSKIGAGPRYRARAAAGLLTIAAVVTLVLILGMIGWGGFEFYQTSAAVKLGGACCVSATLFLFVIVVFIGARSLGGLRSRRMGLAAALGSLVCALGGLTGIGMMTVEMIGSFQRWQPFVAFGCFVQAALCLWAGIRGGLIARRADISAAIEENRQLTAKK